MHALHMLSSGLDLAPFALFLNRLTLGLFYFLARFRFFYDPSKPGTIYRPEMYYQYSVQSSQRWFNSDRLASLTRKMQHCGWNWRGWAWVVALIEVVGGLMLMAGIFSAFAAFGLLVLTLFATRCTWRTKVYEQNPVDCLDICSCYLWRVEGLYIVMAAIVVLAGPGALALIR